MSLHKAKHIVYNQEAFLMWQQPPYTTSYKKHPQSLKSTAACINQIKELADVIHGYGNDRLFILETLSYIEREKSHKNFFREQEL